ncbi:MAG: HIT domain-containing protein [Candidatus Pacearchaeota archaeon]|jgi:histidine triad (HIT) family protein
MDDCIFCKIAEGEIPCYKIYEDGEFLAFSDAHPAAEGHTLVIPKKHFENIFELPENLVGKINIVSKKVAELLKEKFEINDVNILNASGKAAQQSVFHIHYHVCSKKRR